MGTSTEVPNWEEQATTRARMAQSAAIIRAQELDHRA